MHAETRKAGSMPLSFNFPNLSHNGWSYQMKRQIYARAARQRNGKGVMIAVADVLIMLPLIIGSSFFVIDSGLASCYKQKLTAVLNQAANYAVNLPAEQSFVKPTESVVKELLKKNNLNATNLSVKVEATTIGDNDAITVSVSAFLPLLQGSFLPIGITLQDQAAAIVPANRVCAAIAINPYPYSYENPQANQSVYVPIIQPKHNMPVWQFPNDTAINNLHIVQGASPGGSIGNRNNQYFADRPSLY